jgi:ketosteroid isomerase-like protein
MTAFEALRAVCDAWENGDADAIGVLFADDGTYEDPLAPRTFTGPAEITEGIRPGVNEIVETRITLDKVVEQDGLVWAEGMFLSKLREADGRLDFPFAIMVEMSGERIRRLVEYFDTAPLT